MDNQSGKRLKHFLQSENIEQKKLAEDLGTTAQYINAICQGRKGLGKAQALRVQELYGVNAGWLLTGQGTMSISEAIGNGYKVTEYEEEKPQISTTTGRPYYNVNFMLGFDTLVNDQTQNPDYLINFQPYNNCDYWCNAYGDSMAPTISSGDIVALKRINDFNYLINGEIYAIVTSNGLRTIKRVRDNGETITLTADNPTIDEQTLPKSIVTHVFHVIGVMKTLN